MSVQIYYRNIVSYDYIDEHLTDQKEVRYVLKEIEKKPPRLRGSNPGEVRLILLESSLFPLFPPWLLRNFGTCPHYERKEYRKKRFLIIIPVCISIPFPSDLLYYGLIHRKDTFPYAETLLTTEVKNT